jgi:hypothetical protein
MRCIEERKPMNLKSLNFALIALVSYGAAPASRCMASFHFMQIEKIVGGVNGDTSAQAIQLRMRVAEQGQVNRGKLVVFDAAGENPVVIVDFANTVRNDGASDRVLVNSIPIRAYTDPPAAETFTMENWIPASYLAAGSLVFENDEETLIVWRVSWGGATYTGDTNGALTNDDDREFGPPFAGPLPVDGLQVLEFTGPFGAKSTSNSADYRLSDGPGVLTNNSGDTFTLIVPDCDDPDGAGPDSDADSVRDVCDECVDDPGKSEPGICGCGVADTDSDFDGIPNCNDPDQGGGNENENENGNSNDNENDNVSNENENVNDNGEPGPDNANDNGGGDNDNTSSAGSSPRGCSLGFGAIFAGLLGLSSLRAVAASGRVRRRDKNC